MTIPFNPYVAESPDIDLDTLKRAHSMDGASNSRFFSYLSVHLRSMATRTSFETDRTILRARADLARLYADK